MTAKDVAYSYDRILAKGPFEGEKPNGFFVRLIPSLDRVVALDKYTLEFRLNTPSFQAMEEVMGPFLGICIVPPEWVNLPEEERKDWRNIPGTGPFYLADFQTNVLISGKRNPNYWAYDPRHPKNKLPYLDEVKVVAIPNIATAIAALRTAKLDTLTDDRDNPGLAEAQHLAKVNPEIKQFRWPANARAALFKYGVEPFNDIRVRKALQMAIDIESISESHYLGEGTPTACGILHPMTAKPWLTPFEEWPASLREEYTYNPEKAKALLAEAGYPNGFSTNIMCSGNDDTTLLQIIKSMWEEVGVKMDINVMDMGTHRSLSLKLKYDQMNWGFFSGMTNPPGTALSTFWSKKLQRIAGINDPKADELIEAYYAATTMDEALSRFKEAEMYFLSQHYGATTGARVTPQFCQPWVKGWDGEHFWGAWGWQYVGMQWIDTSLLP
jgi:peptide/nickel transport system substrate-binding protein